MQPRNSLPRLGSRRNLQFGQVYTGSVAVDRRGLQSDAFCAWFSQITTFADLPRLSESQIRMDRRTPRKESLAFLKSNP